MDSGEVPSGLNGVMDPMDKIELWKAIGFKPSPHGSNGKLLPHLTQRLDEAGIEYLVTNDGMKVLVKWGDTMFLVVEMMTGFGPPKRDRPMRYLEAYAVFNSPEEIVSLVRKGGEPAVSPTDTYRINTVVDDWGRFGGRLVVKHATCGSCHRYFDWCEIRPKRCPTCGTPIDWGEE